MKFVAIALVLAGSALAQSAPESTHNFFDKPARWTLAGSAAVFTADSILTCRTFAHGGHEVMIPSQSCAGTTAWIAGSFAEQLGVSYWLHHRGHHRLERAVEMLWSSGSAIGISYTLTHQRHQVTDPGTTTVVIPVHDNPSFCVVGQTC